MDRRSRGIVVVYDLRDPDKWEEARRDRERWGRSLSEAHALDNDHITIEFFRGGALEVSA
jgi:hypothetical protein